MKSNDELRGVLNSGHRKATARAIRGVGDASDEALAAAEPMVNE